MALAGNSEIKVANFNNMGVVIEPPLDGKTVAEGYIQTLSRLLAWNAGQERFDFLTIDTDGRLHVSVDAAKVDTANHSQATVSTVASQVANVNVERKDLTFYNNGLNVIYFMFGAVATVALGMPLNPGVSYEASNWTGYISMITSSGNSDIRIVEFD